MGKGHFKSVGNPGNGLGNLSVFHIFAVYCYHVDALLFRVEAAIRYGFTNTACAAKAIE